MTEIRELIFPEDRTRYDELVYRRERDPYSGERLRVRFFILQFLPIYIKNLIKIFLQRKGESARDLPVSFLEDLFYDTDTFY